VSDNFPYPLRSGQTVRLIGGYHTPSQRNTLWVIDPEWFREDIGQSQITIYRQDNHDCLVGVDRKNITPATILDLLVAD
jgi:hypothetical protein